MIERHLEYLVALERERHFARAAAACNVTQPTLSAGIRRLEQELGSQLVMRGRRFIGFTPEGERALAWAHRIVADHVGLRQELSALRGGLEGQLRLGVIPTAIPASALVVGPFHERHPRVRTQVVSLSSEEIRHRLDEFELDGALTYLDNEPLGAVVRLPLYRERYFLLTAADGAFAARATVSWAEAATLPLSLLTPDMQNRRILSAAFRGAGGGDVEPAVETDSVATLAALVRQGFASVMAQVWLWLYGVPEGMRAVPLVAPEVTPTVGLALPEERRQTSVATALRDLAASLDIEREMGSGRDVGA